MAGAETGIERRLTTILVADMVGYSRLMGADETGTLGRLRTLRAEVIEPAVAAHHGHLVKAMGDGVIVEFPSVVEAVQCAIGIQREMAARNAGLAAETAIRFRIGINIGDVIVEDGDIYGDGVNIAARLEKLTEPGGIRVSRAVHDQVRDKLDLVTTDLGRIEVHNIARPVHMFAIAPPGPEGRVPRPDAPAPRGRFRLARGALTGLAALALVAAALLLWPPDGEEAQTPFPARAANAPAIAVLPFENMSGDPGQDYFSDGITADLINDLSQLSGLMVIARNTMFTYKDLVVSVRSVGEDLGVDYVLEGSVRRAGNRIRVNAQLASAASESQIWAERYDREIADVFALQDEITGDIVSALAVRLTGAEEERLADAAKADPEAYDLLLRGLERYRRYTRATNIEAREFFRRAIAVDPDFARAHADLALTHFVDAFNNWVPLEEAVERALGPMERALALDPDLPQVHFALSDINTMRKRHDASVAAARRAIELDPNYADGYGVLGLALLYSGEPEAGLEAMEEAMALNPRHPFFYIQNVGHAHFMLGRYEAAAAEFRKVIGRNPHFLPAHLMLAATYGQMGRDADAAWEIEEALVLSPGLTLGQQEADTPYRHAEDLAHYIDGLRKAGLPE